MQLTEVSNRLCALSGVAAMTASASAPVRLMIYAVSSGARRISAPSMRFSASLSAHSESMDGWPPIGCHTTVYSPSCFCGRMRGPAAAVPSPVLAAGAGVISSVRSSPEAMTSSSFSR